MSLVHELQTHIATPTYHGFDVKELYSRAFNVYRHLGKWLSEETKKEDIARDYRALGSQRRKEGFALSEVIEALILTRHHLWLKVLDEGLMDSVLDLAQAMELNNRVIQFFDRAIYYASCGFEQED
jgi:hypothetical protein